MSSAVSGLVGVAIGALIAGGFDFGLQWRRERAALKVAKRLVSIEVQTIWLHFSLIIENMITPVFGHDRFLGTSAWEHHRETLAAGLDDKTWGDLAHLTHSAARLREIFERDTPGRVLRDDEKESIAHLMSVAVSTYATLSDGREIDADP